MERILHFYPVKARRTTSVCWRFQTAAKYLWESANWALTALITAETKIGRDLPPAFIRSRTRLPRLLLSRNFGLCIDKEPSLPPNHKLTRVPITCMLGRRTVPSSRPECVQVVLERKKPSGERQKKENDGKNEWVASFGQRNAITSFPASIRTWRQSCRRCEELTHNFAITRASKRLGLLPMPLARILDVMISCRSGPRLRSQFAHWNLAPLAIERTKLRENPKATNSTDAIQKTHDTRENSTFLWNLQRKNAATTVLKRTGDSDKMTFTEGYRIIAKRYA